MPSKACNQLVNKFEHSNDEFDPLSLEDLDGEKPIERDKSDKALSCIV